MMEMEDIKRVQLSEIVELITKGTTPTTLGYEFQDKGVNFLKIECFDENGGFIESKVAHISEECHKKMKRSQLKNGDILFSIAGAIGRVAIVTEEMLPANINQALAIIRISDEQVYLPYIKLILTSQIVIEQFERKKQGVAQLNLSLKDINEISIPLPGKDKQIELAELFDKVVGVISKRNKELSVLDDLIKARFVEMFGDVIRGNYHYETKKLGDVANIGSSHRVFTTEFVEYGIPFYRGTEIGELANGIKPTEPYYISEEHYNRLTDEETKPQIGDLLMPSICNKGQVWMVDTEEPFYYKDGRVLCISPDREIFNTKYLEYYMRAKILVEYPKLGSGSTFAEFKIFLLKDIEVLIPPRELQNQFADFVHKVDKSKVAVQKALDETQLLFDSLMQKYFG